MRRVVIGLILIGLIVCPSTKSQQLSQEAKPLKDLRQVRIVVEHFNTSDRTLGLSETQLESQVLVGLKRNISRLSIDKNAESFVYVNIASVMRHTIRGQNIGAAVRVELELFRPVFILSDDYPTTRTIIGSVFACVWDKGSILTGPRDGMARRVQNEIDNHLTEFAADYYRQNP